MAKLSQAEIRQLAISIVQQHPSGIRYGELLHLILDMHSEIPRKTVIAAIWDLQKRAPDKVVKPSRGLYTPAS
jgi:hypothetical protein